MADELYGLSPEDFTAARNARAKQARSEKDRDLADRITSLRKPTMAAWATNQLVREHADEVDVLLELGRELRDVMADIEGDDLRQLTRQRYQLVSALVQQARSLALSRGKRLADDAAQAVRGTLEATLSDDASADAVATGRLTDALEVSGFSSSGQLGSAGRGAVSPRTARKAPDPQQSTVADLDAERIKRALRQAERDVAAAEKAAERSRIASDRAQQRLQMAEGERDEAAKGVDRARQQLDEASSYLSMREQKAEEADAEAVEARRRVEDADDELTRAQRRAGAAEKLAAPVGGQQRVAVCRLQIADCFSDRHAGGTGDPRSQEVDDELGAALPGFAQYPSDRLADEELPLLEHRVSKPAESLPAVELPAASEGVQVGEQC